MTHGDIIKIHIEPDVLLLGRFGALSNLPRGLRDPARAQPLLRRLAAEPDAMRQIRALLPSYSLNRHSDHAILEMLDGAIQSGDLQAVVVADVGMRETSDVERIRPDMASAAPPGARPAAPAQAGSAHQRSLEDRIAEVISRAAFRIPDGAKQGLSALLAPEGLAIVVKTIAIGESANLAPYGWATDPIIAGAAFAFGGLTALDALGDLVACFRTTTRARTDHDLDAAAQPLARAVVALSAPGLMAVLHRVATRKGAGGNSQSQAQADRPKPPRESARIEQDAAAAARERLKARWQALQENAKADRNERSKHAHDPAEHGKHGRDEPGKHAHDPADHGKHAHDPADHGKHGHDPAGHGKHAHDPADHSKHGHDPADHAKHGHDPADHGKHGHDPADHGKHAHDPADHGKHGHDPADHGKHAHKPSVGVEFFGDDKKRHRHEPSVGVEFFGDDKKRHRHEPSVDIEFSGDDKKRHGHEPSVGVEFSGEGKERHGHEPLVGVEFSGDGKERRGPEPSVDVELIGDGQGLVRPGPPENQNPLAVGELEGEKSVAPEPSESGKALPPGPLASAELSGDGQELPGPAPSENQNPPAVAEREGAKPLPSAPAGLSAAGQGLLGLALSRNQNLHAAGEAEAGKSPPAGPSEGGKPPSSDPTEHGKPSGDGQKPLGPAPSENRNPLAATEPRVAPRVVEGTLVDFATVGDIAPGFYRANPNQLRFGQHVCSPNFSDGGTTSDLIAELVAGKSPDLVGAPLRVIIEGGVPFTLDNRRLVAFCAARLDSVRIQVMSRRDPAVATLLRNSTRMNPIAGAGRYIVVAPTAEQSTARRLLLERGLIRGK